MSFSAIINVQSLALEVASLNLFMYNADDILSVGLKKIQKLGNFGVEQGCEY
jgi:hypothetical protein